MKSIIIIGVLVFNMSCSYSQKKDSMSILYTFPESVSMAINDGIKLSKISYDSCVFKLSNCENDFCVEILPLNSVNSNLMKYVKLSNRFAVVQEKQVPVIFDFDMNFIKEISSTLSNTGGGYVIRFDRYGKVVSKSFQN
ncbi:MAG: hypothetical protein EOP00_25100 [Pedobacter sp.]|nr:MAG: hypothetical protein EOP00_25100 [Pedobacter sp.]